MSYSTLWKVYKTTASPYKRYQNGHGSAPPVWQWLCDNFLDGMSWLSGDISKLWSLYKNNDVPENIRFALLLTFDNAIIKPENLKKASELAEKTYNTVWKQGHANHWLSISEHLNYLSKKMKDKRVIGIALGCTSVSDPWWDRGARKPFPVFEVLQESEKLTVKV